MKKVSLLIISILIIGILVATISAEIQVPENSNWWDSFLHDISKWGLFEAEGQMRMCSINSDSTYTVSANYLLTGSEIISKCSGEPSALVDVFKKDINGANSGYLGEWRYEAIASSNGLRMGTNTYGYEIQVYCCPYAPCDSNSDCDSAPASNYGNTCNVLYGSCYSTTPTHKTKVYKCISQQWVYQYEVSYGSNLFCNEGLNNYLNYDNSGSCLSSSPSWCADQCTPNCACASSTCTGQTCSNGCGGTCVGTKDCGGSSSSSSSSSGGGIPEVTCVEMGGFCDSDGKLSCGEGNTNIGNYDCSNLNNLWLGACCKPIGGNNDQNGSSDIPPEKAVTLTWSEYYSKSDLSIIEDGAICLSDSDCQIREGYDVSCKITQSTKTRIWEGQKDWCKEYVWAGHGLLGGLIGGIINILVDPCAYASDLATFFQNAYNGQSSGICIAESKSWYGSLWDNVLKTVGSLGIPADFVLIVTIILIIIILSFIPKLF